MLQFLKIQNYAIINDIGIDFTKGLNVITGETGAGKSILLGALGLILGNRVDNSILKNNDKKCIIEGTFVLNESFFKDFFDENGLDFEKSTIIHREINPNGSSRAFINDTPVNLNILKEFSEKIIDIHSQHQTVRLSNQSFQLDLLDSVSNHSNNLNEYKILFYKYKNLSAKLSELEDSEKKSKKDLDYMLFQLEEIRKANLHENEDAELEQEFQTLSHAGKIKSNLSECESVLNDSESSITNLIAAVLKQLNEISSFHSNLEVFSQRLNSLYHEIKDIASDIQNFESKTELDQERLDFVVNRLNLINHLLSKHQFGKIEELLSYYDELQKRVAGISSLENDIVSLKKECGLVYTKLTEFAGIISIQRQKIVASVEKELKQLLMELGMKNAEIKFELSQYPDVELKESGKDKVNILFSTNPGMPLQPVSKIASGGELSRLMLGIKYIMADTVLMPTIIFDEIDMGISGEIAIKVGQMLNKLAKNHQVINISHLPQIASMGQSHYLVYKEIIDQSTQTLIRRLSNSERIIAVAKMIGGDNPTEANIRTSKEMIDRLKN